MQTIKLSKSNKQQSTLKAISVLKKGGLIIYPTETCYGVGVDATNKKAVEKLLKYKQRPVGKAVSIAVSDKKMANDYVEINKTGHNLYDNFLPGPITVVSEIKSTKHQFSNSANNIVGGIAAEDGSLGIRIPGYPFTLDLIKQFGKPITATSANLSGRKTPYSITDILENASEKNKKLIDLIIDAGELPHNPPSTVVDVRMNDETVLREGKYKIQNPKAQIYNTSSAKETIQLGGELMKQQIKLLKDHCVIFALSGELGAGKTQFAKGVAKTLGIKENISSPTFTLVKEYEFSVVSNQFSDKESQRLFHIDTWRMQESSELSDLGFNQMVKPGNVIVIEWIEKVKMLVEKTEKKVHVHVFWVTIEENNTKTRMIKVK